MRTKNRLDLVLAFLLVLFPAPAFADDGSWTEDAGYLTSGGALYSEGKSAISLEKEFLELVDSDGHTRAVFLFKNAENKPADIGAAFPIGVKFEAQTIEDPAVNDGNPAVDFDPSLGSILDALGIPTGTWEPEEEEEHSTYHGSYFSLADYPKGRKELSAETLAPLFGLHVTQDGAAVQLTSCVVDFGKAPGEMTLHFRHTLRFKASTASRVEVTYQQPLLVETDHEPTAMPPYTSTSYQWNYVLETASSWKDPVGQLVLALPAHLNPRLPAPWRDLGTSNERRYFVASNWEPRAEGNLHIGWVEQEEDTAFAWERDIEAEEPTPPAGVRFLSASSFIPDRADAYLPSGIWKNAPFDGARLLDGSTETAWAVRSKNGGIGESVKFRLEKKMYSLTVFNGYQRSSVDYAPKKTWSFFERNNRVKTLDLIRDRDGLLIRRLALQDVRDGQWFPVTLEAGDYRVVIVGIYPGTQWNDTCLGELAFSDEPAPAEPDSAALKQLSTQDFFKDFLGF